MNGWGSTVQAIWLVCWKYWRASNASVAWVGKALKATRSRWSAHDRSPVMRSISSREYIISEAVQNSDPLTGSPRCIGSSPAHKPVGRPIVERIVSIACFGASRSCDRCDCCHQTIGVLNPCARLTQWTEYCLRNTSPAVNMVVKSTDWSWISFARSSRNSSPVKL